jgi:hypothetical protein
MTIEAAGIPGACSIWADSLDDGPVPAGLSDRELVEVRMRHLTANGHGSPHYDADLREWRDALQRHEAYDELMLWYEHDVFRPAESDSTAHVDSRPPSCDHAGVADLHRRVPRTSGFQRPRRAHTC